MDILERIEAKINFIYFLVSKVFFPVAVLTVLTFMLARK